MRQRACGVVIRDGLILMVRHVHDGRDYWTLPGGGINPNESKHAAAKREVLEETGIEVNPLRLLFSYEAVTSISHCVLMTSPPVSMQAVLGIDPEESHLPEAQRMLREVAWHDVTTMGENPLVARVVAALQREET
jgi:8-oxo-dGTP diphosphatase